MGKEVKKVCMIEVIDLEWRLNEILKSILGISSATVLTFHMKRVLGEEPLNVLLENPRAYYDGLKSF